MSWNSDLAFVFYFLPSLVCRSIIMTWKKISISKKAITSKDNKNFSVTTKALHSKINLDLFFPLPKTKFSAF